MADGNHSDEELTQAEKDGAVREGTAVIHHKLFQKYGFLVPDNPLYPGETIFFGLTAHVDASKKYIADLREELKPDERVKYMAASVEMDGTRRWKGLVVAPLPPDQQYILNAKEKNNEVNPQWLICKVLPNLQTARGFATPLGLNHYYDNVYFSLQAASEGLGTTVTDLTTLFKSGEVIKALVVPADIRFSAKYKALKVCKIPPSDTETPKHAPSPNDDNLVEEIDQSVVSWIYEVLKTKGSVKLTCLTGNLSNRPDLRNVVQPKKKSVRKFLAKYPQFFTLREDSVHLMPNCPRLQFGRKSEKSNDGIPFQEENWSEDDDSSNSCSEHEDARYLPSPVPYTSQNLKAVADISSKFPLSMLASIVRSLPEPMKMAEIFNICQQRGWEGMKSVAMVAQIVTNNKKYFLQDDKSCITLTPEGKKLSVKLVDKGIAKEDESTKSERIPPSVPQMNNIRADRLKSSIVSPFGAFPYPGTDTLHQSSVFNPTIGSGDFNNFAFSVGGSRSAFSPVGTATSGRTDTISSYYGSAANTQSTVDNVFPTSSVLPSLRKNYGNSYVYDSDGEDSSEDKSVMSSRYTKNERQFLSVIARAICPHAVNGSDEVYKMLKKQLEALRIMQDNGGGDSSSGVLSRHLVSIHLDIGKLPSAKFQHFAPSGKINQTMVSLRDEEVTKHALAAMLDTSKTNEVIQVGRTLYGISETHHCIRKLRNDMDQEWGCTVSFKNPNPAGNKTRDLLEFGERKKFKIILSDVNGTTTPALACSVLQQYATQKSSKSSVIVLDMEGEIFGFGNPIPDVRRIMCSSLDSQQHQLKEAVHHHPNYIIANSIDCEESLKLLERIGARGIVVYAEVSKSLERIVKKTFEVSA